MEKLVVLFLICRHSCICDHLVVLWTAVLAVVVSILCLKQIQHIGRIVVVVYPAISGNIKVTVSSGWCESCPLNHLDIHSNSQLAPCTLQILCQRLMIACVICHILDGRESLSIRIACIRQKLFCLSQIALKVICMEELTVLCDSHFCEGRTWLYIGNAWPYEISSRGICSLHDSVRNISAVKSKA